MKATALSAALVCALVIGISTTAADGSGARASGARTTVRISHFKYQPGTVVVSRGTTVVFSNASPVAHTATRRGSFNTGRIKPGHAVAVRFTRRGTFGYFCVVHPFMHGKIVVR